MGYNKFIKKDGTVLLDLTGDDATAADVAAGKKFHLRDGTQATGTATSGGASMAGGYTVTFMASGKEHAISAVTAGQSVKLPTPPASAGLHFTGWYTAASGGTKVTFPYTPTADVTLYAHFEEAIVLGFTGLSASSGALTWTDDIANSEKWSVTETATYASVSSPLDDMFPFSELEEFTDSSGNVFVKFPKCYIKFITNSSGVIDGFKVSNVQAEDDMFIPDCFLNPTDDGASYLDYFALGKYEMSGSSSKGYSKSGATCLVSITRANARAAARAYGTASNYYNGYQQLDFSMLTLYNFLCMLYYKTANIQTVWGGRTGSVQSWSAASVTGTCNGVNGKNGWNLTTDCVKMLGIENPYGNISKWVDGVCFSESTIYAHRMPQSFADTTTGGVALGFSRPTSSGYISALKKGTAAATKSYVYASAASGSATSYVGDRCYYNETGVVLYAGGSWGGTSSAGLWYLVGSDGASFSTSYIGARLSYRPL